MPQFSYIVKDSQGKRHKDVLDAPNEGVLVAQLQKQGFCVINISKLDTGPIATKQALNKSKKKKFSHKKSKLEDVLSFSRQLATMLEAGVSLTRCLVVIHSQIESEELFHVLSKVMESVEQGSTLSLALAQHPNIFNQFWISLIEVGEASGSLPTVLTKLAFYLEQQARFRSAIISGIIYPAILFCVSMGAVLVFALVVGPKFEAIFNSMGAELPMITVVLLSSFRFLKEKFFLLAGIIWAIIFIFKKYTKTYQGKLKYEQFLFKCPIVGNILQLILVERFSSQMAILIDAGVPILYALEITERLVDNHTCARIVNSIRESVKEGESLVAPMERSGFFPPMCVQMITVGEETGELSAMLKHVSSYYQEIVETFMNRFSTIIEPFMLVFMGAIIGLMVTAMFLPMFNLSQLG